MKMELSQDHPITCVIDVYPPQRFNESNADWLYRTRPQTNDQRKDAWLDRLAAAAQRNAPDTCEDSMVLREIAGRRIIAWFNLSWRAA